MKVHNVVHRLSGLGLDDTLIRQWLDVCYPAQVDACLRAFSHLEVAVIAEIGMKGARGYKPGIKRDRDQAALSRARLLQDKLPEVQLSQEERRAQLDALADEFL